RLHALRGRPVAAAGRRPVHARPLTRATAPQNPPPRVKPPRLPPPNPPKPPPPTLILGKPEKPPRRTLRRAALCSAAPRTWPIALSSTRSEERRVGKEGRVRRTTSR